ncbi:unnamed protein product, partial [Effrenium voratum]
AWEVLNRRRCLGAEGVDGTVPVLAPGGPEGRSLDAVIARMLHDNAVFSSWQVCWTCASAMPKLCRLRADNPIEVTDCCKSCSSIYVTPLPEEWPVELMGLTVADRLALRPFVLLQGDPSVTHGAGQVRHGQLSALRWATTDVEEAVRGLGSDRAARAFRFLMANGGPYCKFIQEHRRALANGQGGGWLVSWKLLEKGLEAALWPDLYFTEVLLDTKWAGKNTQHASVKQSFLVKACSSVLDYSLRDDLLHWHYDRHILARFAGRASSGMHMRWSMKDLPEMGWYWEKQRLTLVDLHRQLGPAQVFLTLAPGVHTVPWNIVPQHARDVAARREYRGGVLESLHLHHLLQIAVREYLVPSEAHFGAPFGPPSNVVAWAFRIEYQDGTRSARQHYHGTGAPHAHVCVWLRELTATALPRWLRADSGSEDSSLEAAVARQQGSQARVREPVVDRTAFDEDGQVQVCRDAKGKRDGVRPYLTPLTMAYFGHHDVQLIQDSQQVAVYMSKLTAYVTKPADGPAEAWLESASSAYQAARMLLRSIRPGQAQMVAAMQHGGSFVTSCNTKTVVVRRPDEQAADPLWLGYCNRAIGQEAVCFLDWARVHHCGKQGVAAYQKKRHMAAAVYFGSKLDDNFYGQWLSAFVPCRSSADLVAWIPDSMPETRKWFAAARAARPELWDDEGAIREWLAIEGSYDTIWIQNYLQCLRAWRAFCALGQQPARPIQDRVPLNLNREQVRHISRLEAILGSEDTVHHCYALLGPAGSGKTAVALELCRRVSVDHAVVICTPTGVLADEHRHLQHSHGIRVDTVASVFQLGEGVAAATTRSHLPYGLIFVDEVGFLDQPTFEEILRQWDQTGRRMPLLFAGDRSQLSPPSGLSPAMDSARWPEVVQMRLSANVRASNKPWADLLADLRHLQPTRAQLRMLTGNRVLASPLTAAVIQEHISAHPDTLFLALTRPRVRELNALIDSSLHDPASRLGVISSWDRGVVYNLVLHDGTRVMVNYNVEKSTGLVNGMFGKVSGLTPGAVLVRDDCGTLHAIPRVTVKLNNERSTGYPVVLGYACTFAKVQGRTMRSITIAASSIPEVRYASQVLTSHTRPNPTRDGKLMKNGLEKLTAAKVVALMNNLSADSRNRPAVSFSVMCGALNTLAPILRQGQKQKILGSGVTYVLNQLEGMQAELNVANTFGKDCPRDEASMKVAVDAIFEELRGMWATDKFQDFLMATLKQGVALTQLSMELLEWGSLASDVQTHKGNFHRIRDQPESSLLKSVIDENGKKRSREKFQEYLSVALSKRQRPGGEAEPASGSAEDFSRLGAAAVSDDGEEEE